MPHLLIASLDFTHQTSFKDAASAFLAERPLIWGWVSTYWQDFTSWLSQPHVLAILMAWWITFTLVITILMTLGFGPAGVLSGSLAAAFQSWMYGGFTPAAGIFATLTSVGMLGLAMPVFAVPAALIATLVSVITWLCVRG
ncbi:hypothetical protein M430DRAFT_20308 [Amorphotheca resinae ATCC 22711]|uniref:Uncharacterized protein n=1 Tax=Amorphotheca resinae ATCC 22711 TaxID=857342 RepID=A0A2T3AY43_AMORE|nr:hypothetical protein M430DRAFT_20308 [Amorphotheca resinae ATCC 22711]PSS14996.1 hypothetical protein M430DRAFT_20308 [Amorphotheca resinae ATCC 22711]